MVYELRMRSRSTDWNQWREINKTKASAAVRGSCYCLHRRPYSCLQRAWAFPGATRCFMVSLRNCLSLPAGVCIKCQVLPWKEGQGWVHFMFDPLSVTNVSERKDTVVWKKKKQACAKRHERWKYKRLSCEMFWLKGFSQSTFQFVTETKKRGICNKKKNYQQKFCTMR